MDNDIQIRPFKWQDGLALKDNPNEKGLKGHTDFERWLKLNESEGPGFTVLLDDKIVGCGGVRLFWKGVGEAWIIFPDNIGNFHIDPQIVKDKLQEIIEKHKLQRIEISPQCDWAPGLSYARWLGFEREGKRRKYLPSNNGELVDCYMMSIIREN